MCSVMPHTIHIRWEESPQKNKNTAGNYIDWETTIRFSQVPDYIVDISDLPIKRAREIFRKQLAIFCSFSFAKGQQWKETSLVLGKNSATPKPTRHLCELDYSHVRDLNGLWNKTKLYFVSVDTVGCNSQHFFSFFFFFYFWRRREATHCTMSSIT